MPEVREFGRVARDDRPGPQRAGDPGRPGQLDADPWLLNCPNGTLDLRTGQLREHRREDLITKLCPTRVRPGRRVPDSGRPPLLQDLRRRSAELVDYFQRLCGYCLTGDVREQILPIFWGDGSNGKSADLSTSLQARPRPGLRLHGAATSCSWPATSETAPDVPRRPVRQAAGALAETQEGGRSTSR